VRGETGGERRMAPVRHARRWTGIPGPGFILPFVSFSSRSRRAGVVVGPGRDEVGTLA